MSSSISQILFANIMFEIAKMASPDAIKTANADCHVMAAMSYVLMKTAIQKIMKPIVKPEKNSPIGPCEIGFGPPA